LETRELAAHVDLDEKLVDTLEIYCKLSGQPMEQVVTAILTDWVTSVAPRLIAALDRGKLQS